MSEQMASPGHATSTEDEPPMYRLTHLLDDLADAFSEHIQDIAPFKRGGIKPRVQNRATFTIPREVADRDTIKTYAERRLEVNGYEWTTGSMDEAGTEYVVLGRQIPDLRGLRKEDRIHVNKRRGPFKVYRVLEQEHGPEVLQRSAPSVTAELSNVDTGTDWMLVQWQNTDSAPMLYVKTKDEAAKGGYRHRKVEDAHRLGRIGPMRRYALAPDVKADVENTAPTIVERAREHGLGENRTIHPSAIETVERLFRKPVAEAFTPADANTVRGFLHGMADWHEREAGGLTLETDEDKEQAGEHQRDADTCQRLADAFNLLAMDAVDEPVDPDASTAFYVHDPCGKGYVDRFRYSTHCNHCQAASGEEQTDEQTDEA